MGGWRLLHLLLILQASEAVFFFPGLAAASVPVDVQAVSMAEDKSAAVTTADPLAFVELLLKAVPLTPVAKAAISKEAFSALPSVDKFASDGKSASEAATSALPLDEKPVLESQTAFVAASTFPLVEKPTPNDPSAVVASSNLPMVEKPVTDDQAVVEAASALPLIDKPVSDGQSAAEAASALPLDDKPVPYDQAAVEAASAYPLVDQPVLDNQSAVEAASALPLVDKPVSHGKSAVEASSTLPLVEKPVSDGQSAVEAASAFPLVDKPVSDGQSAVAAPLVGVKEAEGPEIPTRSNRTEKSFRYRFWYFIFLHNSPFCFSQIFLAQFLCTLINISFMLHKKSLFLYKFFP